MMKYERRKVENLLRALLGGVRFFRMGRVIYLTKYDVWPRPFRRQKVFRYVR